MTATMRRAVLTAIRTFDVETVAIPTLLPGHVRLRVQASGICGSDLHTYLGENPVISTPIAPGHEFAGVIDAVADDVDTVSVGDFVAARPSVPCGVCGYCAAGQEHLCDDMRFVGGLFYDGAFAQFVLLPASCVIAVDPSWSAAEIAFAEPAAVAVHTVKLPGDISGQRVLIVGCGAIGLLVAQAARLAGAHVSVTDLVPAKVALAEELGAARAVKVADDNRFVAADGGVFDCAFDCVGFNSTLAQSMASVKKGGTVVLVGVPVQPIQLDPVTVLLGERRLIGSYIYTNDEFATALDLILSGQIQVKPLITASYSLEEIGAAFEVAVTGNERVKLVLEP